MGGAAASQGRVSAEAGGPCPGPSEGAWPCASRLGRWAPSCETVTLFAVLCHGGPSKCARGLV